MKQFSRTSLTHVKAPEDKFWIDEDPEISALMEKSSSNSGSPARGGSNPEAVPELKGTPQVAQLHKEIKGTHGQHPALKHVEPVVSKADERSHMLADIKSCKTAGGLTETAPVNKAEVRGAIHTDIKKFEKRSSLAHVEPKASRGDMHAELRQTVAKKAVSTPVDQTLTEAVDSMEVKLSFLLTSLYSISSRLKMIEGRMVT